MSSTKNKKKGMTMLWRVMCLFEKYNRMTLTIDEVGAEVGLASKTIRNRRLQGDFQWLLQDGRTLLADIKDVADYLEARRTGPAIAPA